MGKKPVLMRVKLIAIGIVISCLTSHLCYSQKAILKITDSYFRYNPFKREFKNFLTHLLSDTLLADKQIIKRTDSTLFFFKGTYKKYNSFDLKPTRVEIRLAESEVQLSQSAKDTILLYQVLIYTNSKDKGANDTKKEFERFNRKYKSGFNSAESKDITENNKAVGSIMSYFINFSTIPPVTVAYTNSENEENVFAIILRIKVVDNMAALPYTDLILYNNNEKEEE